MTRKEKCNCPADDVRLWPNRPGSILRKFYAILLTLCSTGLAADEIAPALPQLYDVTGVSADDHLNIRALPDATSDIIGRLAADATDVEVTALSLAGQWGRINHQEQTGWVAFRYLAPRAVAPGLSELSCFGTEPFWTMNFDPDGVLFLSTPERSEIHPVTSPIPVAGIGTDTFFGLQFDWLLDGVPATGLILPGQCNDGMSDRRYALNFVGLTTGLKGCCTLQ